MTISFIVAAYNIERYIQECINSVFFCAQSTDEIIVINDGSTDRTLDILESLCINKDNIRLITKANGGLSSARNAGLSAATKDYVLFLDGDDALIPENFLKIRTHLDAENPDILITDHLNWMEDGKGALLPSPSRSHAPGVMCLDRRKNLLETLNDCIPCVWTRLIRRSVFRDLPTDPFLESLMYDDLPITPHLTALASSLLYIAIPLVQYRSRADSLTKLRTHRSCTDMVLAAVQAAASVKRLEFDPGLRMAADMMLIRKTMEAIRQCRETEAPSYRLYSDIIRSCLDGLHHKPHEVCRALQKTKNIRDARMSNHLKQFSQNPKIYALLQTLIAKIKQ